MGEYVTPSAKIATIVKTNPLKVNLQLPEAEAARVRVGLPVTLSVAAFPNREFAGQVTALNPAVDQTSRALTVEAQVDNAANQLHPGMFVTARSCVDRRGHKFIQRVCDRGRNRARACGAVGAGKRRPDPNRFWRQGRRDSRHQ